MGEIGETRFRSLMDVLSASLFGLPSPLLKDVSTIVKGLATGIDIVPRSCEDLRAGTSGEASWGGVRDPITSDTFTGDERDEAGFDSTIVLRLGNGESRRTAGEGGPLLSMDEEGVRGEGMWIVSEGPRG